MSNIVKGSIQDAAEKSNQSISRTALYAQRMIALDVSGSMEEPTRSGKRKIDIAYQALIDLQKEEMPGNTMVYGFSYTPTFAPNGVPEFQAGPTELCAMLKAMLEYDDTGLDFVLISDGYPTDGDHSAVRQLAERFITPIQTIFIGDDCDTDGIELMRMVSAITKGKALKPDIDELKQSIKLLTGGAS